VSLAWRVLVAAILTMAAALPSVASAAPPVPDAAAYLLVDEATGTVLAQHDPDESLPMASTTKIMTALVTLERADLDDIATVPEEAEVGGSTAKLVPGERISVRHLLTGLLIASGNDAAVTLAVHVAGSQQAFVALMNQRARAMGLEHTSFANPHGLDEDGHYSSVADLIAMARVAMSKPFFRNTVRNHEAAIPGPGGVGTRVLDSRNDLLGIDPSVDGVKTGNTDGAGYAIVAHARRADLGAGLYLAMIGSPSEEARANDAEALIEYGFSRFARPTLAAAGQALGDAPVRGRPGRRVEFGVDEPFTASILLDGPGITETLTVPREVPSPVRAGDPIGALVMRQGERELGRRELVALEDVDGPGIFDRLRAGFDDIF
jgi:D-alanyl-D-alanine carboxypeptidase (penicillin-binding protein 5/6)